MKLITVLTEKPTGLNGLSETHTVCVINPLYVLRLTPLPKKRHSTEGTRVEFNSLAAEPRTLDVLTDIHTTQEIIEHALNSPETIQGSSAFSPQLRLREEP